MYVNMQRPHDMTWYTAIYCLYVVMVIDWT